MCSSSHSCPVICSDMSLTASPIRHIQFPVYTTGPVDIARDSSHFSGPICSFPRLQGAISSHIFKEFSSWSFAEMKLQLSPMKLLQRVSSPVGNSLRMTSWKSGGWLWVVVCWPLESNKNVLLFFFLINKFVLIYTSVDGEASHPSMKIITLKSAFEVLVLNCV